MMKFVVEADQPFVVGLMRVARAEHAVQHREMLRIDVALVCLQVVAVVQRLRYPH